VTPAETLLAAAEAIDGCLDGLPPTPWFAVPDEDSHGLYQYIERGPDSQIAETFPFGELTGEPLAKWIALSPTLLRMVGEYLEDLAGDALEMPADMRAVAIAEIVLLALAPQE